MPWWAEFGAQLLGGGAATAGFVGLALWIVKGAVATAVEQAAAKELEQFKIEAGKNLEALKAELARETTRHQLLDERRADVAAGLIVASIKYVDALKYVYNPLIMSGERDEDEDDQTATEKAYLARLDYLRPLESAFREAWHHARVYLPSETLENVRALDESAGDAFQSIHAHFNLMRVQLARHMLIGQIQEAWDGAFAPENHVRWDELVAAVEADLRTHTFGDE